MRIHSKSWKSVCVYFMVADQMISTQFDMRNSKMHIKTDKIFDLSILPPVCHLHFSHSNYVSKSWKSSFISVIDFLNIKDHGWMEDGSIL